MDESNNYAFLVDSDLLYSLEEGNELFDKVWVITVLLDIIDSQASSRPSDPGNRGIDAHPSENDGNNRYEQDKKYKESEDYQEPKEDKSKTKTS